jgi:hypothetical protein
VLAFHNSEEIRLYDASSGKEKEKIGSFSEKSDIRVVRADEHLNRVNF